MKLNKSYVPEMPLRVSLGIAENIGVFVRPVKYAGVNFWTVERIDIVAREPATLMQTLFAALTRRPVEPWVVLDWAPLEQLPIFLNEGQAISYAQNMIAQRPNTHKHIIGEVIFGANRVPVVKS